MVVRDRETVSRWAHNPKIGGSTPSPATKKKIWIKIFWAFLDTHPKIEVARHVGLRGSLHLPQPKNIYYLGSIHILIGSSLVGRASDSESGGPRFES